MADDQDHDEEAGVAFPVVSLYNYATPQFE